MTSSNERCFFNLKYRFEGSGLNNGDYEYNPYLVLWGSYLTYDRVIVDQMEFTKSYIKEGLKKAEKTKAGKKVKALYKKGKKGYKKGKAQYKEEKKGIKEYRAEKKAKKIDKRKKAKEEEEKKSKSTTTTTTKNLLFLDKDYDSNSGSETTTESSVDEDEDDKEDESDEVSESSVETDEEEMIPETKTSLPSFLQFSLNSRENVDEIESLKQINIYKESSVIGDFDWPGTNESKIRGDENLWAKLMVFTSHSGQISIDKKEIKSVKRTQQAGVAKIQLNPLLSEIFNWYNGKDVSSNIEIKKIDDKNLVLYYGTSFYTPKMAHIKSLELKNENPHLTDLEISEIVTKLCTKGKIIFEFSITNMSKIFIEKTLSRVISIHNFYKDLDSGKFISLMNKSIGNNLKLRNGMSNNDDGRKEQLYILYSSALHEDIVQKSFMPFISNYVSSVTPGGGGKQHQQLYTPFNKQVENLHMAYYSTEQGELPVINFMIRKKKEEFNEDSERYFLIQLAASLKRNGIGPENFVRVIDEQFSRKDDKIVHNYLNCVEAVNGVGSFAATQVLYTSDFRYPNIQFVKKVKPVNIDSWDVGVSAGYEKSADCEDMASLAIEILNYIKEGRLIDKKTNTYGWNSKILQYARKILLNRITSGIASTVTEAFVDARGQKLSNKDLKDLPIVGDEIDLNSPVGGHFFGFSTPNAIISKWLKNSPDFKNYSQEMKEFVNREYAPWEYKQSILIIEGTAMIKSDILPPEESFEGDKIEIKKNDGLRKMFKFIRSQSNIKEDGPDSILNLKEHNPKFLNIFNLIMTPEGLPFYFEKQENKNKRISKFYKDVVHFIPTELYKLDNTFSQLIFCYKNEKKFGVNIGDILRDKGQKKDQSNIMLIRPLINPNEKNPNISRDLWSNGIIPLMNTVINQQPVSIIGNYTENETNKLCSKKVFDEASIDFEIENSNIKNNMILTGSEKKIKITNNFSKSYIIDGRENPILYLDQGIHYNLKINSKGHPFWILQKHGNEYIPFKGIIENNGIDNGIIKIFLPCGQDISFGLIYMCGHHKKMTGIIAINQVIECDTNLSGEETMPTIDYKYKKPKWHFDTDIAKVIDNDNLVVMKWFTRDYHFKENNQILPLLKKELSFLKQQKFVIDYAFFEQKYFPQVDACIELLLILDVNQIK